MTFMKKLAASLLTICLLIGLLPMMMASANSDKVEIKLTIGQPTVTINGEQSKIEPPYVEKGTTMVPLSVITKAFGAKLKLEQNKIITLTYNNTKVVVTIGSKKVTVNGKTTELATEARTKNGVTMVPLRVITQAFGAVIAQPAAKEIVITGKKANTNATAGNGTIKDEGKTKIGDSYFNWTMNYPAGLAQVFQSDNGDWNVWADTEETALVYITVREMGGGLTRNEVRNEIQSYFDDGEIRLESRTVTTDAGNVEKVVTQTRDKRYFEYRGVAANDRLYVAIVGTKGSSKQALDKYQTMLNSFQPKFDKADKAVKDVSKVKNGMFVAQDREFGLTVQLPLGWQRDPEASIPWFESKDEFFLMNITSLSSGDTLDKWVQRSKQQLLDDFLSDYMTITKESTVMLPDGLAKVVSLEFTFNKVDWYVEHHVYLVKGSYKYEFQFNYNKKNAITSERLFSQIISTADIDTDHVEEHFSYIEDSSETDDKFELVAKSSRAYGYSISVPSAWNGEMSNFEHKETLYFGPYASLNVYIFEGIGMNDIASSYRDLITESKYVAEGYSLKNSTVTSINGLTATKLAFEVTKPFSGQPHYWDVYLFERNGHTYSVSTTLTMANATASNRQVLESVVNSFKFN